MASVTSRIRLVASAVRAAASSAAAGPRTGTLDLLSQGRLVVQPSVSWSRDECWALGVPFAERGRILDEQLAVMDLVFRESPASYHGRYFDFDDIYLELRRSGPRAADVVQGQTAHGAVVKRLVRYGHGFHPLGVPTADDMRVVGEAMTTAGRNVRRPGIDWRRDGGVSRRPLTRRHRQGDGQHTGAAGERFYDHLPEAVDVHRRRRRTPGFLRRRDGPG
jgi:alkanesulfonate monooxygenase SsuD/methylene tetrahydromethanopterin reductase-like flavin-dependent oxidoreductase (luciferase family)